MFICGMDFVLTLLLFLIPLAVILFACILYGYSNLPDWIEDRLVLAVVVSPHVLLQAIIGNILYLFNVSDIFCVARFTFDILGEIMFFIYHFDNLHIFTDKINNIPVLVYENKRVTVRSVVVYIHGGGLIVGCPKFYHNLLGKLSTTIPVNVIAITYRRSPSSLYPSQFEDCCRVMKGLEDYMKRWNLRPTEYILMGDSAGGQLCMSMTYHILSDTERLIKPPKSLILIYPTLQGVSLNTPSFLERDSFALKRYHTILGRLTNLYGRCKRRDVINYSRNNFTTLLMRQQLAAKFNLPELANKGPEEFEGSGDPRMMADLGKIILDYRHSPLLVESVANFPPTVILASNWDILYDDSVMLHRRLEAANVPTVFKEYPVLHGLIIYDSIYRPKSCLWADAITEIRRLLSH